MVVSGITHEYLVRRNILSVLGSAGARPAHGLTRTRARPQTDALVALVKGVEVMLYDEDLDEDGDGVIDEDEAEEWDEEEDGEKPLVPRYTHFWL